MHVLELIIQGTEKEASMLDGDGEIFANGNKLSHITHSKTPPFFTRSSL